MASAWMETDGMIQQTLQAYITELGDTETDWFIDLYKNDHVPTLDDDESDYDVADFDGYAQGPVSCGQFGGVTVTDHVAISVNNLVNNFTASAVASAQIVYGYFITQLTGELVYAERFSTPITVNPNGQINITPALRHTTLPA